MLRSLGGELGDFWAWWGLVLVGIEVAALYFVVLFVSLPEGNLG